MWWIGFKSHISRGNQSIFTFVVCNETVGALKDLSVFDLQ